MKKITLSLAAFSLFLSAGAQQTFDRSIRPKAGPAPTVTIGKSESFTLSNGLKVFVVENHKLPTVAYSLQLDINPILSGNKAGMTDIFSEMLTSGTTTRSSEKLAQDIDMIAARIRATSEGMYGTSLKRHQNKLLELMADIAMNAKFTQAELDKTKKQTLSGLEAGKNEPDAMLENVTSVVNYGAAHPYGEVATPATVSNITLADLATYYNTYYRPNVGYLAVVGDITVAEVKPLLEKYFGKWKKADVPSATYTVAPAPKTTDVVFVPREAAVQSVFNVTYPLDLKPGSPDAIKAQVANAVLGNGSQGRLFLNLREAHGWTYGAYSSIDVDPRIGNFTAYSKTRNAVSDSAINEVLSEMRKLRNEPVGNVELQALIANMSGAFAIGLEDPQRVAQYAINTERFKLPKDYYTNYLRNLSAVSAADVQAVAQQYIRPEAAHIIVVGDKTDVAPKLARFAADGKLDYRDNYGNPIKVEMATAAPVGVTAADVLKKYVAAVGGEKAIGGIKSIKTVYSMEMQGMKMENVEIKQGGKMKGTMLMNGSPMQVQVYNGDKAWAVAMGQKEDITDAAKLAGLKEQSDIQADLHPEKYGIARTVKSQEGNLIVVEKVSGDEKTTEYYDATSGLLMKAASTQEGPQGPMSVVSEFGDYQEVPNSGGYKVPGTVTLTGLAPIPLTMKLTSVEVNKTYPASEFQ